MKIRNFILNELFFLAISGTIVLILVLAGGILFDIWYKEWLNILYAGSGLYGLTILFRLYRIIFRKKTQSTRKPGRNM